MKNRRSIIVSLACLVLIGASAALAAGGGHVTINREANFGQDLFLVVSVDGKQVAQVSDGQNYDANLSAGKHTITTSVTPNRDAVTPVQTTLNVKDGETYSFTAVWKDGGQQIALHKN